MAALSFTQEILVSGGSGVALERAASAIGRLDGRICGHSLAQPWALRAAWIGYAQALQLHGIEIDEIDVFSWGLDVPIAGRPPRSTVTDIYAAFPGWRAKMAVTGRHWAEDLPFSIAAIEGRSAQPLLARAVDLLTRSIQADPSLETWLALPIHLYRLGLTERPLPCLVAGDRRLRWGARDPAALLRRLLSALTDRAEAGLRSLLAMEQARARAIAVLHAEHRPGALRPLLAMMQAAPVQTPEAVSRRLGLTLSGAGKLLQRAARLGLVHEVSNRRSWRLYLSPDLGVSLGFISAPRGRPRLALAPPGEGVSIDTTLSAFDSEMAAWEERFGGHKQV